MNLASGYTSRMDANDRKRLEELYRALPGDEPLEPGDPRYFPIYDDPKLTSVDPVEQLARRIEWSDRGTIQFLVGSHRCGKSTEFLRLKDLLERKGHPVVLVDVGALGSFFDLPTQGWLAFVIASRAWRTFEKELDERIRDQQLGLLEQASEEVFGAFHFFRNWRLSDRSKNLFQSVISELKRQPEDTVNALKQQQDLMRDVFLASLERLSQSLSAARQHDRKLVVLLDSLEHVFHGSSLLTESEWPKFGLNDIHQVISLGPNTAGDAYAYRYIKDDIRWIDPLDVYGASFSQVRNCLVEYLDRRSESWKCFWELEDLNDLLRFSGGSLGEFFRLMRKVCQDARSSPIESQILYLLMTHWKAEQLDYFREDDYVLLDDLMSLQHVKSLAAVEVLNRKAVGFFGRSERVSQLFNRGAILYRQDRGFFVHPALAPEIEKRRRDLMGYSTQLSQPVAVDECLHFKTLEITNLRVFEDFKLELRPPESQDAGHWILLLGDNGVGKTTFLRSIVLALADRDAANALFQLIGPTAPFLRHGAREGSVEIRIDGRTYRADLSRDQRGVERIADSRDNQPLPVFAYGCQRGTALGGPGREVEFRPLDDVRTLFEPNGSLIHAETWLARLQLAALQEAGGADESFFDAVRATLIASLDGVESLEVEKGEIWLAGPSIGRSPLACLSDAYITTAGWIIDWIARWADRSRRLGMQLDGDFRQSMTGLVLIDEIDLHLHPRWQVEIVQAIRDLFPRTSFVATTHNPLTLLGAHPSEIHILRRDEEGRVEVIQRDIPPGARADQILTGDWFGLPSTVDRDTLELLEKHRELLRQQAERDDPERRRIEDELRHRLGTFADTSIERMAQSIAAELAEEHEPLGELEPQAREELRRKILEVARERRSG